MLSIGGAEFDLPQCTPPPTVGIYIHQRNTGKGRGLQQHMHTTGDSNSDEKCLKTRTPPTTKPQIQKTRFCNNKNIPHPISLPHPGLSVRLLAPTKSQVIPVGFYTVIQYPCRKEKAAPPVQQEVLVFNILRTSVALEHTQEPSKVTVKSVLLVFFF